MEFKTELLINMYGQNLIDSKELISKFNTFNFKDKKEFLNELLFLLKQSKPLEKDINVAINNSNLKPTFTPCVLLRKGLDMSNLEKIINLPENELGKVVVLFLELFRISYRRRYLLEKNDPNKWWYWDLSDENNINKILAKGG